MAYMQVIGPCWCCGRVFGYNAEHVPSIRVHFERQPVCGSCMELANQKRIARGLTPFEIHPQAYEPQEVE